MQAVVRNGELIAVWQLVVCLRWKYILGGVAVGRIAPTKFLILMLTLVFKKTKKEKKRNNYTYTNGRIKALFYSIGVFCKEKGKSSKKEKESVCVYNNYIY